MSDVVIAGPSMFKVGDVLEFGTPQRVWRWWERALWRLTYGLFCWHLLPRPYRPTGRIVKQWRVTAITSDAISVEPK